MKWANTKKRRRAIWSIAGCLAGLGIWLALMVLGFLSVPATVEPVRPDSRYGESVMQRTSAAVDPVLLRTGAFHILDALFQESLEEGDCLIRIDLCARSSRVLEAVQAPTGENAAPDLFWTELGKNREYRAVYFGPIDTSWTNENIPDRWMDRLRDRGIFPDAGQLIVESVWRPGGDLTLVYEGMIHLRP
jgi:hypothetical protein